MVKNEKYQCPSARGGPEDFKFHPTFVSSAIFGGVMASQTWEHLFGTPCSFDCWGLFALENPKNNLPSSLSGTRDLSIKFSKKRITSNFSFLVNCPSFVLKYLYLHMCCLALSLSRFLNVGNLYHHFS